NEVGLCKFVGWVATQQLHEAGTSPSLPFVAGELS
ncbi:MAG: hypothetical protein ACI93T_003645, partial [Porticoccaceae bacterium]